MGWLMRFSGDRSKWHGIQSMDVDQVRRRRFVWRRLLPSFDSHALKIVKFGMSRGWHLVNALSYLHQKVLSEIECPAKTYDLLLT